MVPRWTAHPARGSARAFEGPAGVGGSGQVGREAALSCPRDLLPSSVGRGRGGAAAESGPVSRQTRGKAFQNCDQKAGWEGGARGSGRVGGWPPAGGTLGQRCGPGPGALPRVGALGRGRAASPAMAPIRHGVLPARPRVTSTSAAMVCLKIVFLTVSGRRGTTHAHTSVHSRLPGALPLPHGPSLSLEAEGDDPAVAPARRRSWLAEFPTGGQGAPHPTCAPRRWGVSSHCGRPAPPPPPPPKLQVNH